MSNPTTRHTKSAGGIVLNSESKVLVVNQRGNSWSLPKGHVEQGEDIIMAAKREIMEESGLKELTLVKELGSYVRYRIGKEGGEDRTELKHITMFLFRTIQMNLKPIDPDNPEAKWVDIDKVADTLTHPKDKEFYSKLESDIRRSV